MVDLKKLTPLENVKAELAVFFFLMLIGIPSCGGRNDVSETELQTLNFHPLYQIALSEAKNWKSDAYLVRASLPIWAGSSPDSATSSFGFHSSSDRKKWLLVRIHPNGSSASSVEMFEGVYEEERPPASKFRISDGVLTSEEALSIISINGGAAFVSKYGTSADSYMVLEYSQSHFETLPLEWVGHFHLLGQTPNLIVKINAHTGEVIEAFNPTE